MKSIAPLLLWVVLLRSITAQSVGRISNERESYRKNEIEDTMEKEQSLWQGEVGTTSDDLVEIWTRETELAQTETERLLMLQMIGSLPPARPPVPKQPSASPVLSPMASLAPTNCLSGRTEEQYLLDELSQITPALERLLDPSMPQGMALNFMLADDLVRKDVCLYPTLAQRYGLASFYYSTNGSSWIKNTSWLTAVPECEWYGVECADNIRVTNLTMASNNIAGSLPDEVAALFMLDRLELYSNNVTGTIPSGIANLTSIEVLDLEANKLTGLAFPSAIGSLSTLRQLFLSSNNFTGTIPSDIDRQLGNISDLWAANNELVGPIPESMGRLSLLNTLILYGNNLDGSLPASLGNLTAVSNLQLYRNVFDQTVPLSIFDLTQLTVLRIDQNFLTGTLGTEIGQLSRLTDLRINNNFFEGTIPTTIGLIKNLTYMIAGTNLFSGPIPNAFAGFQNLIDFDLSTSFYTGSIPDTIFGSPALKRVYLSNNALTGPIPASYATAPNLVDLFLDNNQLVGTIPAIETGALPNLNELLLQNNLFNGTMPTSVCLLRTAGALEQLVSDCGGATPELVCPFPDCCNRCFEGGTVANQRRLSFQRDVIANAQRNMHQHQRRSKRHEREGDVAQTSESNKDLT